MSERKKPTLPGKEWDVLSVTLSGETLREIESDVYALIQYGDKNGIKDLGDSWLFEPGILIAFDDEKRKLAKKIQHKMCESGSWVLQVAACFVVTYHVHLMYVMMETVEEAGKKARARTFPTLEYNLQETGVRRAADAKEDELLRMMADLLYSCDKKIVGNLTEFRARSSEKEAAEAQRLEKLRVLRERSARLQGLLSLSVRMDRDDPNEPPKSKPMGHIVAVRPDGSVMASGEKKAGQCAVDGWRDITAVAVGKDFTVGLMSDGSVLATGDEGGTGNAQSWRNIRAVAAGMVYTAGLTADGRVLYTGNVINRFENKISASEKWRDITAISASFLLLAGRKKDGTVVVTPSSDVFFDSETEELFQNAANLWSHIASVSCGQEYIAGLRTDGTVVAAGENQNGQCNVFDWSDIVSVCCGFDYTVGLRADGTVVYAGGENYDFLRELSGWRDIAAISIGSYQGGGVVGIRTDGSLVVATDGSTGLRNRVANWKLFDDLGHLDEECERKRKLLREKDEEERRKKEAEEKKRREYRTAKRCQYCGGTFTGFFSKKCSVCGHRKDY